MSVLGVAAIVLVLEEVPCAVLTEAALESVLSAMLEKLMLVTVSCEELAARLELELESADELELAVVPLEILPEVVVPLLVRLKSLLEDVVLGVIAEDSAVLDVVEVELVVNAGLVILVLEPEISEEVAVVASVIDSNLVMLMLVLVNSKLLVLEVAGLEMLMFDVTIDDSEVLVPDSAIVLEVATITLNGAVDSELVMFDVVDSELVALRELVTGSLVVVPDWTLAFVAVSIVLTVTTATELLVLTLAVVVLEIEVADPGKVESVFTAIEMLEVVTETSLLILETAEVVVELLVLDAGTSVFTELLFISYVVCNGSEV